MKTLERRYSKIERIVAKAKFSAWLFLKSVILAVFLGGIIAVVWVYRDVIESWFTKTEGPAQILTDDVMRWVLLGAGALVAIFFILQCLSFHAREFILTEDKIVYRQGLFDVKTTVISLDEIKIIETNQKFFQRFINAGDIQIITDAEKPCIVKNVKGGDRLVRKIMNQVAQVRQESAQMSRIRLVG